MQSGPGNTGRTLAARPIADGRIQGAGHFTSPQWTDTRQDRGEGTKAALTTVKRYRAGERPEWAKGTAQSSEEEEDEEQAPAIERGPDHRLGRLAARERDVRGPEVVRRRREREESDEEEERERPAPSGRGRAQEDDQEEEEDEDAIERRREMARLRRKQMEEQEELAKEEDVEEEEEESEYETDSEEEAQGPGRRIIKPVFVPKKERDTVDEEKALLLEEEARQRAEHQKLQRKSASKAAAGSIIQREAAVAAVETDQEPTDVDTDDEKFQEEEYTAWSVRERLRIRSDRDAREKAAEEREEMEAVRHMSEAERLAWERSHPKVVKPEKEKAKYAFMQKYYHKGAFFQEAPDDKFGSVGTFEIYKRDFSQATGEDKVDKNILPSVMHLRKGQFGRAGRTKWTHLTDQDTTAAKEDDYTLDQGIRDKYYSKMAATNQPLEKPKTLRR